MFDLKIHRDKDNSGKKLFKAVKLIHAHCISDEIAAVTLHYICKLLLSYFSSIWQKLPCAYGGSSFLNMNVCLCECECAR